MVRDERIPAGVVMVNMMYSSAAPPPGCTVGLETKTGNHLTAASLAFWNSSRHVWDVLHTCAGTSARTSWKSYLPSTTASSTAAPRTIISKCHTSRCSMASSTSPGFELCIVCHTSFECSSSVVLPIRVTIFSTRSTIAFSRAGELPPLSSPS
eukprot:gene7942-biopygen5330